MRIGVYGSLRRGQPLHRVISSEKYIGNVLVDGYDLYADLSKQSYPFIKKGDGKVLMEVYDVHPAIGDQVGRIEESAGYRTDTIEIEGMPSFEAYVHDEADVHGNKLGTHDWIEYKNNFYLKRR